ncbi:MAG: hypothetical protein ACFB0E_05860 [Leptolyngbyaceae cyanobacterium]
MAEHHWPEVPPHALPSAQQLESELESVVRQLEDDADNTFG